MKRLLIKSRQEKIVVLVAWCPDSGCILKVEPTEITHALDEKREKIQ